MREVLAKDVRTGRVLCMPEVTDQQRTVICMKAVGPTQVPDPKSTGNASEGYHEPEFVEIENGVVRLGVYPPWGGKVQYFEFNADSVLKIDDPRGCAGSD